MSRVCRCGHEHASDGGCPCRDGHDFGTWAETKAVTFTVAPCSDCFHAPHPLRRCAEIVGSSGAPMPDPVYCECADVGKMEARIRELERERDIAPQIDHLAASRPVQTGNCSNCGTPYADHVADCGEFG